MKKSQELSLNMIVVGSLALLVLLIVGGILIFSGGDILGSIQGMSASQEEVAVTTFKSTCASKCRILQQLAPPMSGTIDQNQMGQIKAYCCENYDLNSNGIVEKSTTLGPEYCALAYAECRISGRNPSQFCTGSYNKIVSGTVCPTCPPTLSKTDFDFTLATTSDYSDVETCDLN